MRTHISLIIIVLVIIAGSLTACVAKTDDSKDVGATYSKITPQQAKELMDTIPMVLVDVRTPAEYQQGHIKGAILLPNGTITTEERPDVLSDLDATIIVYCRSGNRSAQAAKKLVALGYTSVYDIGGIGSWPYGIVY